MVLNTLYPAEIWHAAILKVGHYTLEISQLVAFSAILLATFTISKFIHHSLTNLNRRTRFHGSPQLYIVARVIHYCILIVGFVVALAALGIDVTTLALVASALGVGVGLGLQSIVNDFVSGLAILFEKTLKIGDFIELDSGITGEVKEIHMRATLVRTNDNVDILIPNSTLANGKIINWTLEEDVRRFRIPFGVAYGSNKETVRLAALEAAASIPYTLYANERQPTVWMTGFGDSSLNFTLGVWVSAKQVKRPTALISDYLWALDDAFRIHQIEVPFPQRDLHIKTKSAANIILPAEHK